MKKNISVLIVIIFFSFCKSYSQEKNNGQEIFSKHMKTPKKLKRLYNVLNYNDLLLDSYGNNCWKKNDSILNILDGKTTIYSEYQTTGTDNPTFVPYLFAEGEFLEGKYQGIWKFYDKNKKLIKKEKWDNGNLIYRKKYNETE